MNSDRDKCKISVLVSGGGTNLQAIFDAEEKEIIKSGKVTLVASNRPEAYALKRAKKNGVRTFTFNSEEELIEELDSENPDLIVLAGFLKILSRKFTSHFNGRIINIHPALLPAFGGKGCYGIHVHEMALARGVKITGATVHYVTEVPDGGEIIAQKAVNVSTDDTPASLQKRVMEEAEWVILPEAIENICKEILEGR